MQNKEWDVLRCLLVYVFTCLLVYLSTCLRVYLSTCLLVRVRSVDMETRVGLAGRLEILL